MQIVSGLVFAFLLGGQLCFPQSTFEVTGTAIPTQLLQANYGKLPAGVIAYDLSICNVSKAKQSIVTSEIFQALSQTNPGLQPIGRQIVLSAILRTQNHSGSAIATMALNSVTTVLSILSSAKYSVPTGLVTGAALGAVSVQQLLNNFKPVLSPDKLEKFEQQVLEPALVLDEGSCVERTVFAAAANPSQKNNALIFRVR